MLSTLSAVAHTHAKFNLSFRAALYVFKRVKGRALGKNKDGRKMCVLCGWTCVSVSVCCVGGHVCVRGVRTGWGDGMCVCWWGRGRVYCGYCSLNTLDITLH
jgi:hypothetical protein